MFDYQQIFDRRGELYNRATSRCAGARWMERHLLLERLALETASTVCDAPAGGGYVADGIVERVGNVDVICVEPSAVFARTIASRFRLILSPLDAIALPDRSVDRVASLAGLHHLAAKDAFFREAARIVRPGGRIAVADVLEGTPPAHFLNGAVDRLCETGHRGVFLRRGELTDLLRGAGFTDVREDYCEYTWDFADAAVMEQYCGDLFGLTRARDGEVGEEIARALRVERSAAGVHLAWSLVYASGARPH